MSLQNSMKHPVREKLIFLSAFLQSPRIIGSIIPSSKHLALSMIRSIPQQEAVAVAELGSGTGAITRYIAQVDAKQVLLFEQNSRMRQRLEQAYPAFQCHHNALQLREVLDQSGISQLDCIWSGLPFFNFAQSVRNALLEQILLSLKPGGWFKEAEGFGLALPLKFISIIDRTPFGVLLFICHQMVSCSKPSLWTQRPDCIVKGGEKSGCPLAIIVRRWCCE